MRGDRLRGRMGMGGVGSMGVRRQGLRRRETRVVRAMHFLQRLKAAFVNEPEVYRSFLFLMHAFRDQRVDIDGVVQEVTMLLAGHPALLQGFSCFLPDDYNMPLRSQKAPRSFYYHLQINSNATAQVNSNNLDNNNNNGSTSTSVETRENNRNSASNVNCGLNHLMTTLSDFESSDDSAHVGNEEDERSIIGSAADDAAISMTLSTSAH